MKNRTKILTVSFMLLLALVDVALAGEGVSLSISCTIPAIPGVNAPLIEEQKPQIKTDTPTQPTAAAVKEETLQQAPAMIQQDNQKETSENQATLVMVKTLYSR